MKVEQLMTRTVWTCGPDDSLQIDQNALVKRPGDGREDAKAVGMNRKTALALAFGPVLALAGCGMGVASPSPDVAAYEQTVSDLQSAVTAHQNDSAVTLTQQDCTAEHQRYDDLVRPQLGRMTDMSGGMDDCGRAMGHAGPFEMRSRCGSMQSELNRHATAACSSDPAANHAEAAHHCQLMRDWLGSERTAVDSMMMMGRMMRGGRCSP